LAFNVFGGGNSVTAGPGFLIVAGSLGQTFATITQKPFGININGAAIPSAATINPAAKHGNRTSTGKASGTAKPHKSGSGTGTAHSARG
jgi:hypothetical protein